MLKLVIKLENGEIITRFLKEKEITKNELFMNYLNDYIEMEDWSVYQYTPFDNKWRKKSKKTNIYFATEVEEEYEEE